MLAVNRLGGSRVSSTAVYPPVGRVSLFHDVSGRAVPQPYGVAVSNTVSKNDPPFAVGCFRPVQPFLCLGLE